MTTSSPSPRPLTSDLAACCWIPQFALRCEETRHPGFTTGPAAVLSPDDARKVWQVSRHARRAGIRSGMTVSQAIGLAPTLKLCEADPVHYDERFSSLLVSLTDVSPVVEPAELGRVFVGLDGLEGIHGDLGHQIQAINIGLRIADCGLEKRNSIDESAIRNPQSAIARIGVARGKFIAWVAASRTKPGSHTIVSPGTERTFLGPQPLAVLPLDTDTHRRLLRLGLSTLRDLSSLPEEAVTSQFGDAGRTLWRLASGKVIEPVVGRRTPEPIAQSLTFYTPVGEREFLLQAFTRILTIALAHPRRIGWRVREMRAEARIEPGASWLATFTLKDPTAELDRLLALLRVRIEQTPLTGAVEKLTILFTDFAPGTTELQLFARDAGAEARARRRDALRTAAHEIRLRFRRPFLQHVIEVQPWSRLPERRYALIDFEP
ncbi:MAG TPA: DNA polymerase Y family protein [Gemmatimonadales bacterium]|nr:DNA polymerase Y family protein [Gemmatimonadales bacterium]